MADRKRPKEAFLLAKGKVNLTMETKGTGSIVQLEKDKPKGKCRKWQLRVSVGIDPRTGKYRQRTRTFNGTYTEAKRALPDFIAELSGQTMAKSGKIPTFEECAEEWLEKRIRTREVSDGTVETYRIRLHVLSRTIGRVRVDRLTTEQVQESMVAMMDGDTPTGRHAGAQYTRMLCNAGKIMYRKHAIPMGVRIDQPVRCRTAAEGGATRAGCAQRGRLPAPCVPHAPDRRRAEDGRAPCPPCRSEAR